MSRRRKLEQHRHNLSEVRGIMHAMKTLAYMETRKLTRFLAAQQAAVQCIEAAASDFLGAHPLEAPSRPTGRQVYLIIGAERGFCGDFNHQLLREQGLHSAQHGIEQPLLLLVGHKLQLLLDKDPRVAGRIDGAGIAEEVGKVLSQLTQVLSSLQATHGLLQLHVLHYGDDGNIRHEQLLPPFQQLPEPETRYSQPPVLQLPPADFLLALTDHYLYAALQRLLYTSLMAENIRRLNHLEGALKHLDEKSAALARRSNALRQEEIIEEIEVILLSSSQPALD